MYSVVGYIKEMIKSVGIILCMTCTGDKKESTTTTSQGHLILRLTVLL